jgi:CRISPR-associated endoribonuclease Cas6
MIELARLEFRCRWEQAPPRGHVGRALNAWFYGALARYDERLVDALHDGVGQRPFAVALVSEPPEEHLILSGGSPVAHLLPDLAQGLLREGRLQLDGRWLHVEGLVSARTEQFATLVQRHLLRAAAPIPVRLWFRTPAAFHSRGRTLPLPVPDVLFLSLLQRWQSWGGIDLGPGAEATISQCAALRRHRLQSVSVQMEGRFAAFVGVAEFTLVRPEPGYAGLLAALAAFAEFAGVGQKTAMGMGCVRAELLPPAPDRPLGATAPAARAGGRGPRPRHDAARAGAGRAREEDAP